MTLSVLLRSICAAGALALVASTIGAQSLFAPVARVNGDVVTEYEVQQRQRFLQLLNAPGTDRESVLEALIDDRLRAAEAGRLGLVLDDEGLQGGLAEFASRADLSIEEFTQALAEGGIDVETLQDFVSNSLLWRELIRGLYRNRVDISEPAIDRALSVTRGEGQGIRLLLSEIIIPSPPERANSVMALAERIAQSQSEAEFSNFARQHSATASRGAGGRMPWTPVDRLPPSLIPILLELGPGEVTRPLPIPNAVALFQLRGVEETGAPTRSYSEIEYAAYYIAGGRTEAALAEAARVRAAVDSCNDLYAIAQGQPEEVLERGAKAPADIPQDIAIELAKLDPGESSTALTRADGQTLVFLMLCKRVASANVEADRNAVADRLRQEQLQGFADNLMARLRANARISIVE